MSFILTDEQQVAATVSFLDALGNTTTDDGIPVWAAVDATLLNVVAAADGLSAVITAVGPEGDTQVTCTANPADGSGTPIVLSQDIQIVGSAATSGTFVLGTPTAKGQPAPAPAPVTSFKRKF